MVPGHQLAILFLAAACTSAPQTFESKMANVVGQFRDEVALTMGTDAGSVRVAVRPLESDHVRATCDRFEHGSLLTFDPSLEEMPTAAWGAVAIHETVHAHVRAEWTALPPSLEEGLCDMIVLMILPGAEPGMLEEIGLVRRFWLAHAQSLGLDGMRALVQRAAAEGLNTVPPDWLPEGPSGLAHGFVDWHDQNGRLMDTSPGDLTFLEGLVPEGASGWSLRLER